MESTNRLLSLWPGFLLWASLRESMWCNTSNATIVIHPCPPQTRWFSLIFFEYKEHYLLNGYWRYFPALQPLRLGVSSLRKQQPCLDVSLLSAGTGIALAESRWAARPALTSGSCSRAVGLGRCPCTHCSPSCTQRCCGLCHPRCVPASCSWVHWGTELALAQGSISLQPSAGSSAFPLVSVSYLEDSRRSSWHQQAGLGAVYMTWGCQPLSSVGDALSSHRKQQLTLWLYQKKAPGCFREKIAN